MSAADVILRKSNLNPCPTWCLKMFFEIYDPSGHPTHTECYSRSYLNQSLSCTSTDQAQICNDACFAGLDKCIEIECENDVDDFACIKDCGEAVIACDLKCPCEIGGECELGCPCPSFQCEPVCDEVDDLEPSQVQRP